MKADRHSIIKVSLILILTAYLCYLYSADYAKDIPIEKIAEAMEKEPSVTSLRKQGRTELRRFYQIDEKETNGCFYYKAASPMAVEEAVIIKAHDRKQADTFLEAAQSHLSSQKQVFEGYGTSQMALLNEAIAASHGNYVYYFCGADASALQKVFLSLI